MNKSCLVSLLGLVAVSGVAALEPEVTSSVTARAGLPLEVVVAGVHTGLRSGHSGAFQWLLRHRLPESCVDAFWNVTGGPDEIYRYNDELRMPLGTFMPQHATGRAAQRKVLNEQVFAWADQYRTLPRYDVLFMGGAPVVKLYRDDDPTLKTLDLNLARMAEMQQDVVDFVRAGKTLILVGGTNDLAVPSYRSPTGMVHRVGPPLPMQALLEFTPVTNAPVMSEPVAGIPFEWFDTWADARRGKYRAPVPPGGAALTRTVSDGSRVQVGSTWPLGKGRIYYFPMTVSSSTFLFFKDAAGGVDAREAGLRLWEQLAYLGTHGAKAYPVMADVPAVLDPVPAGETCRLRIPLLGAAPVQLQADLRGAGPAGASEWTGHLDVAAGTGRVAVLNVAVPFNAAAGRHPLAVRVVSADGRMTYHEALSTVTVAPQLGLTVTSDRPGYVTGEPVRLAVTARNYSAAPQSATTTVTVFDLDGRALMQASRPLALPAAPAATSAPAKGAKGKRDVPSSETVVTFDWTLPPSALRAYTFWVKAELRTGSGAPLVGEGKLYRTEKWDTRNQLVWGIKNFEGLRSSEHLTGFMRAVAASAMNSVNWNVPTESMEQWGWFGDREWGKPWIRASQVKFMLDGDETRLRAYFRDLAASELSRNPNAISPSTAVASIGEESGYGGGWGTIWEWWKRPASPEGVAEFHRYLVRRYPDIAALNASWNTSFASFDEVPLEEKYVAVPADIDGMPVVAAPRQARYVDTRQFFMTYARWWAATAQEEFRKVLPTPMTVYGYGNYLGQPADLKTEPSLMAPPDQPGFTMAWWPYSNLDFIRGTMWGFLAAHVGHQAGYNGDQCINYDLGLSPLSVATHQFMAGLGGAAPLVLRGHPLKTAAVGQLVTWQPRLRPAGNEALPAAMREAGLPVPANLETNLPPELKFLHVTDAMRVTEARAGLVRECAERGGTVLIGVNFALEDDHGNLYSTLPGLGLDALQGVRQSAPVGRGGEYGETLLTIDRLDAPLPGSLSIKVEGRDLKPTVLPGTTVLARYADGVPALTVRRAGKGTVYWMNAVKPGSDYARLLVALAQAAGVVPVFEATAADGTPARDLFVVPYANDDGRLISFVCVRRGGKEGDYQLILRRPEYRFFDACAGQSLPVQHNDGKTVVRFHLAHASGVVLAAVPYDVDAHLTAPASVAAGQTFAVTATLAARRDRLAQHVVTLAATGPDGKPMPAFARTVPLTGTTRLELATALNDRPGLYTFTLTDLATAASATARVELTPNAVAPVLPPFQLDWPSETPGPRSIGSSRFLDELRRLATLYLTPGGDRLTHAYYQQGHGDTRYNLMQNLAALDWRPHTAALRQAIEDGLTVVLVGEDLGFSPSLRFATYAHNDRHALEALDAVTAGVQPLTCAARPSLRLYRIGKGRLILDRQSWDETVWTLADTAAFRNAWLADVATLQRDGKADRGTPVTEWFFQAGPVLAGAPAVKTDPLDRDAVHADADPNAPDAPVRAD